jgi:3-hydroxybutyryl-CoA dehydrogenase
VLIKTTLNEGSFFIQMPLLKNVGIVGAGQMGIGITFVAALYGKKNVKLLDSNHSQTTKGIQFIDKLLNKQLQKGQLNQDQVNETKQRIKVVNDLKQLSDSDFVIEVIKCSCRPSGRIHL